MVTMVKETQNKSYIYCRGKKKQTENEYEGEWEDLNGHQGTRCLEIEMFFPRSHSHFAFSLVVSCAVCRHLKNQSDLHQIIVHMNKWEKDTFILREW